MFGRGNKDDDENQSKFIGEERHPSSDGGQLKVQYYDDKIVVHEKDALGNTTGHTTDWFDNQVHVHDKDGDRWEGLSPESNSSSGTDESSGANGESSDSSESSSGCFITSAVCKTLKKADDCIELTMFRGFRDTFMQETINLRSEVKEYYSFAPKICTAIDSLGEQFASKEYTRIWEKLLGPAFTALVANDKLRAYRLYKEMVLELKEKYLDN